MNRNNVGCDLSLCGIVVVVVVVVVVVFVPVAVDNFLKWVKFSRVPQWVAGVQV